MSRRGSILALAALLAALALQAQPARRHARPRPCSFLTTQETLRVPCILVEFRDVHYGLEDPAGYFTRLLNEEGFADNGGSGSVRDYFLDNSLGVFGPVFDVYGPVTLDKYRAYYGRDILVDGLRQDAAADLALYEACLKLDPEIDFSTYDADQDGTVDMILYIYAGHDQSQGASTEAIWAHQWNFSLSDRPEVRDAVLDEVKLDTYACAPEFWGKQGKQPAGIGVLCHEFAHTLGLPDLYDTRHTGNGKAADAGAYSLMCNGSANNLGRTPPYLTAEERSILGWLDLESLPELQEGLQSLDPVRINTAYITPTETEGEYFLYEYRDGTGWDAPLPAGLAVYHIDRSQRLVEDVTAAARWEEWTSSGKGVNEVPDHPCYYLLSSSTPPVTGNLVFPGLTRNTAVEPMDWEGAYIPWQITNIALREHALDIRVQKDCGANINGVVSAADGGPLPGATLALEGVEEALTQSGEDGFFRLDLDPESLSAYYTLCVSMEGYREQKLDLSMDGQRMISVPVTLRKDGEADNTSLSKYDKHATQGYYSQPGIGAVRFTPEELAPYAGNLLTEVSFYPYLLRGFEGDIWVTVDIGSRRVLTQKVEMPAYGLYFRNTVDVADAGIVIPEGEDLYVGYGSDTHGNGAFYVGTVYPAADANSYWSPFNEEQSAWKPMYIERAGIAMNVALSAVVSEQAGAQDLTQLGYRYIRTGEGVPAAGETFLPELAGPEDPGSPTLRWFYDGQELSGDPVTAESGRHVLEAQLNWTDGRTESIRKILEIN